MLETIKAIFNNISGSASGSTLAEYYLSRLQTSKSTVEVEAILSMNSLMAFTDQEDQQSEIQK